MYDYHTHSTYSDGSLLATMLDAAEAAGLDGVGIADHCSVSDRAAARREKVRKGFNLDVTYERRREAIESFRAERDLEIYDAVEVDYHPADEARIEGFLADAGFDYAVGSVHYVDGINVHDRPSIESRSEAERREFVAGYFDRLVSLVESGLFDVAAHLDLVERNPHVRGFADAEQYEAVASALAAHDVVPELNAGRIDREYGEFHPAPAFLEVLAEYDVPVTVGSDAHTPAALRERQAPLRAALEEWGLDPVRIV
jgi:histidinol-phosphatase (PHP family)